eukprot:GEZU01002593.1.p1 GENE.GEZU01002593.1~~GEZU01002593.1.p1  ORF type:complete len:201 (+),score=66.86 GEZU01002593.1:44-604(+)
MQMLQTVTLNMNDFINNNNNSTEGGSSSESIINHYSQVAQDRTYSKILSTLKQLTRKGVPPEMRGEVWFLLSGAYHRRAQNVGYYQALLDRYGNKESPATKEVERDIDRTFPDHPYFGKSEADGTEAPGRLKLRRILNMHAFHNEKIGYCQSLNFIAATLLLHMDEESAFWTLVIMLEDYLPGIIY